MNEVETPELRQFSWEEANALLPRLTLEFGRIARLRSELQAQVQALGGAQVAAELHARLRPPTPAELSAAAHLAELADDVARTLARVAELGCLIKDGELGVVDFHAEVDGRKIFFCWQFGETQLAFHHGLDEVCAERQPLQYAGSETPVFPGRWVN